ncbi:MAG: hypothetical protein NC084_07155 [Bacteroides sp.]|nr:hypothetical protein [Eubacterium sp.]MCM1418375.1 hypothetical protein [Roseburia sp.]MCM1462476.1 hypothetical protein [Bacteroides sp.]
MTDFAQKVEIILDNEKILADDIYELNDIYRSIKDMFTQRGMHDVSQDDKLIFISRKGEKDAYCTCGLNVNYLYDAEWARPYLKKMLWYNGNRGSVEDALAICSAFDKKYSEKRRA